MCSAQTVTNYSAMLVGNGLMTDVPDGWENTVYCGICGCPRNLWINPLCPVCYDWPFSLVPNPQHVGWLERGNEIKKPEPVVIQGELF